MHTLLFPWEQIATTIFCSGLGGEETGPDVRVMIPALPKLSFEAAAGQISTPGVTEAETEREPTLSSLDTALLYLDPREDYSFAESSCYRTGVPLRAVRALEGSSGPTEEKGKKGIAPPSKLRVSDLSRPSEISEEIRSSTDGVVALTYAPCSLDQVVDATTFLGREYLPRPAFSLVALHSEFGFSHTRASREGARKPPSLSFISGCPEAVYSAAIWSGVGSVISPKHPIPASAHAALLPQLFSLQYLCSAVRRQTGTQAGAKPAASKNAGTKGAGVQEDAEIAQALAEIDRLQSQTIRGLLQQELRRYGMLTHLHEVEMYCGL